VKQVNPEAELVASLRAKVSFLFPSLPHLLSFFIFLLHPFQFPLLYLLVPASFSFSFSFCFLFVLPLSSFCFVIHILFPQQIPGTAVGLLAFSVVLGVPPRHIVFGVLGLFFGWIYLRFFQKRGDTYGDFSEGFAFVSFFPEMLQ
jgi:hypothetical protein